MAEAAEVLGHADVWTNCVVRSAVSNRQPCQSRWLPLHGPRLAGLGCTSLFSFQVLLGLIVCLCFAAAMGCNRTPVSADQLLVGYTMGTTYSIKFLAPPDLDLSDVATQVERELVEVNMQMSTYIEDSELSRFNSSKVADQWMAVSRETAKTVALAQRISKQTRGAFDVTVGPLVNLWGFGPDGRPNKVPSKSVIESVAKSVGYQKLETRISPPAIKKADGDLQVDLSAIAKGHGVDRVAELLESLAIESYLVEVGGEVRAKGARSDGKPWRLGIESPLEEDRDLFAAIELTDLALATSGDYRNHYELEGQRYSHTIDPRSGRPSRDSIVSASVVMPTCAEADGIATGMMALGFEEGVKVANKNRWPVLLLARVDGEVQMAQSEAFQERFPDFVPFEPLENTGVHPGSDALESGDLKHGSDPAE